MKQVNFVLSDDQHAVLRAAHKASEVKNLSEYIRAVLAGEQPLPAGFAATADVPAHGTQGARHYQFPTVQVAKLNVRAKGLGTVEYVMSPKGYYLVKPSGDRILLGKMSSQANVRLTGLLAGEQDA